MDKVSFELRTENRYILGPQNKKRCRKCEQVYDGIQKNFHIHKILKTGTTQYSSICKSCQSIRGKAHKDKLCETIETYVPYLLVHIKHRAKKDDIPFNLSLDHLVDIWNTQGGRCYYTNLYMDLLARTDKRNSPHRNFPSLDRKVPHLGYVDGNVAWTLYAVNRMKNDLSEHEFADFCLLVAGKYSHE